uniref:26S proteasome regulatory subunit N12 n=3 Tax=Tetraselmis sp. GSL018 TaxID=582737 RepID=A0A061RHA6_9CHLO|mmetsp:Transcript_11829/g.28067  ORF Transcript_11829/g.28067 Transcript_11829/m.28067 type:complete len:264 (-) Transcript_11829:1036-1827(-)
MDFKKTLKECEDFKAHFKKGKYGDCARILPRVKVALSSLEALSPTRENTQLSERELVSAREVLETAVFLSIKLEDNDMFDRNFAQLSNFYTETRNVIKPSSSEQTVVALHLMKLLVENRIAEFHTELELLPAEWHSNDCIKYAVQLEKYLMEGAYHKVLTSSSGVPDPSFNYFMQSLTQTVRDEIANCSEKAYKSLKLSDAKEMMLFGSEEEVRRYAAERGWAVENGRLVFSDRASEAACREVPSLELINYTLTYAKELERIV